MVQPPSESRNPRLAHIVTSDFQYFREQLATIVIIELKAPSTDYDFNIYRLYNLVSSNYRNLSIYR